MDKLWQEDINLIIGCLDDYFDLSINYSNFQALLEQDEATLDKHPFDCDKKYMALRALKICKKLINHADSGR